SSIFGRRNNHKDAGLIGSLRDFGLTDLFQLLGQQQKTGVLNLRDGRKAIQFIFENGRIAGIAFPEETADTSPLGKRLVRGGLLTPEAWKKIFAQHREELGSLESVLTKSQAVRNEDLGAVLRLLISETVYGLFKWTGGEFRFEAREVTADSRLLEPINAEFLLLDVLRMVDEWPLLADRIPNFQMVLRKVNEMATLEILAGSAWADKRTFQMDVIYDLINGQRTISEIIDLSFVGEFETCKNLIAMMDAGMIEPAGINPLRDRRNGGHSQKTLKNAGAYLLLGGLSLALVFQLIGIRGKSFPLSVQEYEGWKTLRQPVEKLEGKKRENAAEVFLIEKNRYPHDQSELIQSGLIPRVPAKP
ncbi:MAG: transcriptional regulator, partial [Deltaproteobacteria bacterium]|nr:transcriptional regulator [Deltaproteobacteria bacterium]